MNGRDFLFSKWEVHQLIHFPHHNHVSIEEDDALSEKTVWVIRGGYIVVMCSAYIVACQFEGPELIV